MFANATPVIYRGDLRLVSEYGSSNGYVDGSEPQFYDIRFQPIDQGRWLSWTDEQQHNNVCVIGSEFSVVTVPNGTRGEGTTQVQTQTANVKEGALGGAHCHRHACRKGPRLSSPGRPEVGSWRDVMRLFRSTSGYLRRRASIRSYAPSTVRRQGRRSF